MASSGNLPAKYRIHAGLSPQVIDARNQAAVLERNRLRWVRNEGAIRRQEEAENQRRLERIAATPDEAEREHLRQERLYSLNEQQSHRNERHKKREAYDLEHQAAHQRLREIQELERAYTPRSERAEFDNEDEAAHQRLQKIKDLAEQSKANTRRIKRAEFEDQASYEQLPHPAQPYDPGPGDPVQQHSGEAGRESGIGKRRRQSTPPLPPAGNSSQRRSPDNQGPSHHRSVVKPWDL